MDIILCFMAIYLMKCMTIRQEQTQELSAGAFLPFRGIFAVVVIIHHTAQRTFGNYQYIFYKFADFGYLPVAAFFAISGYALAFQYTVNPEYLNGFLKKRYTVLFLPYIIATGAVLGIYIFDALIAGDSVMVMILSRLHSMFANGNPILPFSWYVEIMAILYLIFYLVYQNFGNRKSLRYMALFVSLLAVNWFCIWMNYGRHRYRSLYAILIGVAYFGYTQTKYYKKVPRWLGFILSLGCFLVMYSASRRNSLMLLTQLSACTFAVCLFQTLRVIKLDGKVLNYLGSRSYEIYLCQGIPMDFLNRFEIRNSTQFFLISFVGSIILGELLHRVSKCLQHSVKAFFRT